MNCKVFEIRDRATFVPVMVTELDSGLPEVRYLLRRCGYSFFNIPPITIMTKLEDAKGHNDPYKWNDRTFQTAHKYINENWNDLQNGDVIDVEYVLGESKTKKISERVEYA